MLRVAEVTGHLQFFPGELPGFAELRNTCLKLLDERKEALLAPTKANKSYLRPVLNSDDYAAHPEIVTYSINPDLLSAAAEYLGEPAILRNLRFLWTPKNDTEKGSQQWHFDHIEGRQLKLFVYLDTVAEENGPFTYLPADVSDRILSDMGKSWSEAQTGGFKDEEIAARSAPTEAISLMGPEGSGGFIDTTRCLHYGGRARGGERKMLLIQYTRRAAGAGANSWPMLPDLDDLQRAALAR